MRKIICLLSILLTTAPATAQKTIAPGTPSLRADRIRPFTDTIALLKAPRDSAQRLLGTLVRRVERTTGWVSKEDGHLVRLHWTTPDGAEIWKLPKRDVPYLKRVDAAGTRERPIG